MVDPITGAAVGVVGNVGKSASGLLSRWLGPVADESAQELVKRYRQRNVERAVRRGEKKTDLARPGSVPLRVAAEVFEKAQWSEDEFVAEYLSGVLASARDDDEGNDTGVSWASLIGRMSSDQLRLHYVLYSGVRGLVLAQELEGVWPWVGKHLVVETDLLFKSLDWPLLTAADHYRLYEAAYALQREDCLDAITHGSGDYLRDDVVWTKGREFEGERSYFVFKVTSSGIKLFLNGHGYGKDWLSAMENPALDFDGRFDSGDASPAAARFVEAIPKVSISPTAQASTEATA